MLSRIELYARYPFEATKQQSTRNPRTGPSGQATGSHSLRMPLYFDNGQLMYGVEHSGGILMIPNEAHTGLENFERYSSVVGTL